MSYANAQTGACASGTTRLGTDGIFYGCTEQDKWVRISEPAPTTAVTMSEANGTVHQLKNAGFTPIDIAGQTHAVGKTIYVNNHFYEGVAGGGHQIDNGPNDKCLYQVLDKYFGDGQHDFVYCAITGPDGRVWLNNNLGANYSNIHSPVYNPSTQAGGETNNEYFIKVDYNAYGSLFQFGRDADGHELVIWKNDGVKGSLVYPNMPIQYNTEYKEANDPCPKNFRLPNTNEINNLLAKTVDINSEDYGDVYWSYGGLKLTAVGVLTPKKRIDFSIAGLSGSYMGKDVKYLTVGDHPTYGNVTHVYTPGYLFYGLYAFGWKGSGVYDRTNGGYTFPVRCIRNQ